MLVSRHRRSLTSCAALLGLLAVSFSQASTLAGPSPFLPPSGPAQAAPTEDSQIELRGIMAAGDTVMFSIYDTTRRASTWVELNEAGRDFIVRSYDQDRDTVTIDHQGRTLTLALKTAKVGSAPAMSIASGSPPPPAPQPIGGPVVLNPTPADEQRRLEAIAAEVNRRRMIRQQALQASRAAAQQNGNRPPPGRPNARN